MRSNFVRSALFIAAIAVSGCDQGVNGFVGVIGGGATGSRLQVTPSAAQIAVGQTFAFQTNASLTLANQVQWRSLNSQIATVNNNGVVTGIFPGSATIQARFAFDTTQVASAVVTVVGP